MIRYDSNKNVLSIGLPDDDIKRENDKVIVAWDWDAIVWKRARQIVFNLQKRIYKAAKLGKIGRAKHLARLLQNSTSNIVLAVRRVTTDNTGKVTPELGLTGRFTTGIPNIGLPDCPKDMATSHRQKPKC
jgi:hypothetical protein